jgi:hypothetical protein
MLAATLAWAAPEVVAQSTQAAQTPPQTQAQTQTTNQNKPQQQTTGQPAAQTQTQTQTGNAHAAQQPPKTRTPAQPQTTNSSQTANAQAAQTQPTSAPAEEPLYREFKGVRIGTSQTDARKKLGNPEDKSKEMDFFVFSNKERARVYYDAKGNASAVIVTYIGKAGDIPTPKAVLGTDADAQPNGSLYKIVYYPKAGYWVAYSRTAGDQPLTMITMQKIAGESQ